LLAEASPPPVASSARFEARNVSKPAEKPGPIMTVAAARAAGAEVFRNTYYYFPQESDFGGKRVSIHDPSCKRIDRVPADFYAAVCVQGSGRLSDGRTVSFARNRCSCAVRCGRTGQRICFSPLSPEEFPWGRGARGTAITPLRTIAVDSDLIELGKTVFIPEYAGLPMDAEGKEHHDGCFLAEDRGGAVKGRHLDVFTGDVGTMELWNQLVPSNQGVTVVLREEKCEYLANR
jgi:3D (Asp-Asp-Asp) domain-containing protein